MTFNAIRNIRSALAVQVHPRHRRLHHQAHRHRDLRLRAGDALPGTSERPVLAPLTALLVLQASLYQTIRSGLKKVLSVTVGVLHGGRPGRVHRLLLVAADDADRGRAADRPRAPARRRPARGADQRDADLRLGRAPGGRRRAGGRHAGRHRGRAAGRARVRVAAGAARPRGRVRAGRAAGHAARPDGRRPGRRPRARAGHRVAGSRRGRCGTRSSGSTTRCARRPTAPSSTRARSSPPPSRCPSAR